MRRAPYQGERNLSRFQPSPPTRLCFPSLRTVSCQPSPASGSGAGSHGTAGRHRAMARLAGYGKGEDVAAEG